MEENIRSLLAQECFYFRTSLNWTVESGVTLDKCLLVMVERGKASVFVGENEYTLERNQILFMRPELPLKKLRSTTDFSVSLMAFPPSMLRDSTERMEPRFLLLLFTQVIWGWIRKTGNWWSIFGNCFVLRLRITAGDTRVN